MCFVFGGKKRNSSGILMNPTNHSFDLSADAEIGTDGDGQAEGEDCRHEPNQPAHLGRGIRKKQARAARKKKARNRLQLYKNKLFVLFKTIYLAKMKLLQICF